jgi:hypothetical protein
MENQPLAVNSLPLACSSKPDQVQAKGQELKANNFLIISELLPSHKSGNYPLTVGTHFVMVWVVTVGNP